MEVRITKYNPDPVEYDIEDKEQIPSDLNSHREANNTQGDSGRVERMRRRK